MAAEVRSPINRPSKPAPELMSPGVHSLKNRFATDNAPEPKQTAGDRKADARTDAISGAVEAHLARHAMLRLPYATD